jgi:hypothetical protein
MSSASRREQTQKAAQEPSANAIAKQQMAILMENGDLNYYYYQSYAKLYYTSMLLSSRLQQMISEKEDLDNKLERINLSARR